MSRIEAVIFDWAGTTVDYGCFAPVQVFTEVFKNAGVEPTMEEVREPMGMLKWDHIRTMLEMPRIRSAWKELYGREPADADADKLFRAVGNIMRNALAYADANSAVQIIAQMDAAAGAVADQETCGSCSITVVDHGREISPAHLERIFEKFYREGAARSSSTGGAGLGLAIAREIARAHGGDITATSEEGVTTFTLTIPQRG